MRSATARGRAWLLLCHTRFSRSVPEHPTPSWLQMIMCLQIQNRPPIMQYLQHCKQEGNVSAYVPTNVISITETRDWPCSTHAPAAELPYASQCAGAMMNNSR